MLYVRDFLVCAAYRGRYDAAVVEGHVYGKLPCAGQKRRRQVCCPPPHGIRGSNDVLWLRANLVRPARVLVDERRPLHAI